VVKVGISLKNNLKNKRNIMETPDDNAKESVVMNTARVVSVNISSKKGTRKRAVDSAEVLKDHGIKDDAHAANWHRQISLLAQESIDKMIAKGLNVGPGDFAENITTAGIDLLALPVGSRVRIGFDAVAEVTQIGKECHNRCAIYYQAGDCVMPKEGIFVKVIDEGVINRGDLIQIVE
jgi:MOSC domain-containing protein YiiM